MREGGTEKEESIKKGDRGMMLPRSKGLHCLSQFKAFSSQTASVSAVLLLGRLHPCSYPFR